MYIFYNLLLIFLSIVLLPFYLYEMFAKGKYRTSFPQRFGFLSKELKRRLRGKTPIWLHAVSVGEVLSSIALIKKIQEEHPNLPLLVSTVTETGNNTAKVKLSGIEEVIYFPFDFPWVLKRSINAVNPLLFILVETDIWPNFLKELKLRNIPSVLVNGRLSSRSCRSYRLFKFFFKDVLGNISFFSMQSQTDSARIIESGADATKVVTTGNVKFDQEVPDLTEPERNAVRDSIGLKPCQRVFIAGSTHKGEEEILLDIFEDLRKEHSDLVLLLAPRHPERFRDVERIVSKRKLNWARKTRDKISPHSKSIDVVILETIGELFKMYSIGSLVFVGGSLEKFGGHNLLEPAYYKKAVLFGPHMHDFLDISMMMKESGGGIQVKDKDDLLFHARRLLRDPSLFHDLGEAAYSIIGQNKQAIFKNMEIINRVLASPEPEASV